MCGLLALAAVGCDDKLVVENTNQPDRDRALARPTDVENLVAGQYRVIHNAWWNVTNLQAQVAVMGMESFSTNANFGMGVRSGVPRSLVDNGRGNAADTFGAYLPFNQAGRAAALALEAFDEPGFTFFPTSEPQRHRGRAWAYFNMALANGYLALVYDSAAVIFAGGDPEANNPLMGYSAVMDSALIQLDSVIAIASMTPNPTAIPTTWFGGVALTMGSTGTLVQLARTFKARFRAGVARTPAERAAVDWVAVIADATAGVTGDVSQTMANVTGGWFYRPMQMDLYQSWHQVWQGLIGMGDSSGAYDAWLNTPRALKAPFVVVSADRRLPSGVTRAEQNTSSGCGASSCAQPLATAPYPYFRNRPAGQDVGVDGLFHSFYDFYRFQTFFSPGNRNGPVIMFNRAEMDLLAAEGHIRAGNFAAAATLIDNSRVARGALPALSGVIASINDVVPGGVSCVPRVPTGATSPLAETPTATACGNIMEAMKWEKRMEAAFINPGGYWTDARGWGDLPFNTPIQFPVPYTELDSRRQPIYNVPTSGGGATTATGAERLSNSSSNYGYGN